MNITIIGGGNMARALLGGLIARGQASDALAVVEIDADARATVAARFGIATFAAIEAAAVVNADVIVIAVKPQNVRIARGGQAFGHLQSIDALHPREQCRGKPRLVALERSDEMPFDVGKIG